MEWLVGGFFFIFYLIGIVIVIAAIITRDTLPPSKTTLASPSIQPSISEPLAAKEFRKAQTDTGPYDPIDIVIPVGPRDTEIVQDIIPDLVKNCIGLRRIYLVSRQELAIENTILVPESKFPFSMADLKDLGIRSDRLGWYLQQLLKLYAAEVIPELIDNYMVWDADSYLLKPAGFVQNDKALFSVCQDLHEAYFTHMARLHPDLVRQTEHSGICNFMVFNRHSLRRLFAMVEAKSNEPFWKRFLQATDPVEESGASEFEIYFNYMLKFEPDKVVIRPLRFDNNFKGPKNLAEAEMPDIGSCHWYKREIFPVKF